MKCKECGITIPELPEDAKPEEMLCNQCYDEHEDKNKYEEAGKKAFYGLQYEDILRKAGLLPGGCTLQEAIDYFVAHGEELEALGIM